jgi:transcriptional regulator with XRE-family HTH domain
MRRPYPYLPKTLGEFLHKKRLDSNLTQRQTAELLKTTVANIRRWESGRGQVSLPFRPRVIEFVGFCPCNVSLPLGQRLKERRENFGLSIKKLAKLLDVDPCTIASWERGEHQPSQRYVKIIEGFLQSFVPENAAVRQIRFFNQKGMASNSPIPNYVEYDVRWSAGYKILAWRTSVGLSQRQLAKLAGVCFQSVCRWEREERVPKPKYLKRILQAVVFYADSVFNRI